MAANVRVGTSGFAYKEWKGSFYPKDLKDKEMLRYYAERLGVVEINNTFYRMPKAEMLQGWAALVPENFVFVLKAPQKITHQGRLEGVEDALAYFIKSAQVLGARLGALLFQLPPFFKKDVPRLKTFLAALPRTPRVAFEFRNASWYDEETSRSCARRMRRSASPISTNPRRTSHVWQPQAGVT